MLRPQHQQLLCQQLLYAQQEFARMVLVSFIYSWIHLTLLIEIRQHFFYFQVVSVFNWHLTLAIAHVRLVSLVSSATSIQTLPSRSQLQRPQLPRPLPPLQQRPQPLPATWSDAHSQVHARMAELATTTQPHLPSNALAYQTSPVMILTVDLGF